MRHIAEFIAVLACSLFTEAARLLSLGEHPARMGCGVSSAQIQPRLFPETSPGAAKVACRILARRYSFAAWLCFPGRASCGSLLEPCWALLSHLRSS